MSRSFREVKIPVPWGIISGKWWAPFENRPILALHGWQDNCGTFNRLVPLLTDKVGVLAIDLPGHGYSSWLPPGMNYNLMHSCVLIKQIAEFYEWPKITLLGHSLGSIVNFVFTMLYPGDIDYIICIDGVKPLRKKDLAAKLANNIDNLLKYDKLAQSNTEPPSYPLEEIKKRWCEWLRNSIQLEHSHHIVERTIAPSKNQSNQYYFTRDPRLKAGISLNWSEGDLLEGARRVTTPILMIKFTGSGYFEDKSEFYKLLSVLQDTSKDGQYHYIEGSHHTHLNNPERICDLINTFILKHIESSGDRHEQSLSKL